MITYTNWLASLSSWCLIMFSLVSGVGMNFKPQNSKATCSSVSWVLDRFWLQRIEKQTIDRISSTTDWKSHAYNRPIEKQTTYRISSPNDRKSHVYNWSKKASFQLIEYIKHNLSKRYSHPLHISKRSNPWTSWSLIKRNVWNLVRFFCNSFLCLGHLCYL